MNEFADRQDAVKLLGMKRRNLEQQIAKLQTDVEAMKRAEDILSEQSTQSSLLNSATQISSELEGFTPTGAILKVLADRPEKAWKVAELAKEILGRGFKTKSKNFASMVSTTVFRLAKKELIEKIQREGMATRFKKKEKK